MNLKRLITRTGIVAIAAAAAGTVLASSVGPISEETPPATCDPGSFVGEIRCTGRFCDNVRITCKKYRGMKLGSAFWTQWISEERGGVRNCPSSHHYIAGLACKGRYCDKVSLYCVQVANANNLNCGMTGGVSEERGGRLSLFLGDKAGQQFLANGIKCSGRYCDNKAFQVCEVSFR